MITTVAGNGTAGYSGDNGQATAAELHAPAGVAVDSAGDLFIADGGNNVIREVHVSTRVISTVAGNGTAGYSGDNGPATAAELASPAGIALDSAGDLFIADTGNARVREVANGTLVTVSAVSTVSTSTAVTASANPAVSGQTVTLTATVTPGSGTFDNGGTVQFAVDGTNFGSPRTLSNGQATITDSALAVGTHTITATYSGDTIYASSSGSQQSFDRERHRDHDHGRDGLGQSGGFRPNGDLYGHGDARLRDLR